MPTLFQRIFRGKRSIETDAGELQLVGDVDSPGADQIYGTDSLGDRGWYDAPVGSGSGVAVALDLGNDAANESAALSKIATTGDANNIFSEPSANVLLVNVGLQWPDADTVDGQHAAAFQPVDATLTALAAYNTNGLIVQTAADTFVGRTIAGTTNQVLVSNGDGVSDNPTLSLPQDLHTAAVVQFATLTLGNTGLHLLDTNASHDLIVKPGSDLAADRTFTITTGDADRTLTIGGDTTLSGGSHSGTNTGDQTITLTGDVTGSGTGSFAATISNDAVTYARIQNVTATDRLLGRVSTGAGDVEEIVFSDFAQLLVDDATAADARTTLELGTIAVEAATAFARLLGVSGGQDLIGGTASGNNLTLESTSNGTKGKIASKDNHEFQKTAVFNAEVDNGNSSTADTINWTKGNKQKSTLTGNCTFTFTAPAGPCNLILKLVQDGSGGKTVTWPAAVLWPSGNAPTLSTTANAVDLVAMYYDGTSYYAQAALDFS